MTEPQPAAGRHPNRPLPRVYHPADVVTFYDKGLSALIHDFEAEYCVQRFPDDGLTVKDLPKVTELAGQFNAYLDSLGYPVVQFWWFAQVFGEFGYEKVVRPGFGTRYWLQCDFRPMTPVYPEPFVVRRNGLVTTTLGHLQAQGRLSGPAAEGPALALQQNLADAMATIATQANKVLTLEAALATARTALEQAERNHPPPATAPLNEVAALENKVRKQREENAELKKQNDELEAINKDLMPHMKRLLGMEQLVKRLKEELATARGPTPASTGEASTGEQP